MSSSVWTIHNNRTLVTFENLTTEEALAVLRAEQPGDLQYWFAWRDGMASWNPVVTVTELDLNAPKIPRLPKQLVAPVPVVAIAAPPPTSTVIREDAEGQLAFDLGDSETRDDVASNFEIYWMSEGDAELERAEFPLTKSQDVSKRGLSVVANASERDANRELPDQNEVPGKTAKSIVEKDRRKYPRFEIRFKIVIQNDNITFRTYSRNASLGGLALEVAIPPVLMGQNCLIHVTDIETRETIRLPGRLVANRDQTRYFSFFRASAESIAKLQKWLQIHSAAKAS